ncbi:S41 family peptidase [Terrimonas sp. NA20]|uniref:S41 family peptidase n=1 Tax=Terrimonas ginsenosidimutans TaxID=2908004 RepID=A0ABS9KVW9_9BACT|nr:S41 family peptidase [Terrimonas ginsenosidimutans]MCG2616455.1 S41 family peptidase [Terrimonas ginsenosidimutans]
MKKTFLGFVLILIASRGISQQAPVFSVEQLLEDHKILVTALRELHPGIYRYQSKSEFDRQEQQLRMAINTPMTEEQYYKLVMPFIAQLKCGHTKWHRKDRPDDRFPFRQDELVPLKLFFKDNRAWVLRNYAVADTLAAGLEITHINGQKIDGIIAQLRGFITMDGNVQSALYQELNQSFNGYYASFIGTTPAYTFHYKAGKQEKRSTLPAVSLDIIKQKDVAGQNPVRPAFELSMPKASVAVLRIGRFYTNPGETDYYRFIDSAFQQINAAGAGNLVIDLRGNEGGVEEYGGYLFSWLAAKPFTYYNRILVASNKESSVKKYGWFPPGMDQAYGLIKEKNGEYYWPMQEYLAQKDPKANAFAGKVFILTDGFSFSVTSEFASAVKTAGRAVFIGEETGGAYGGDNSGVFASITLPNTKLTTGIPLMAFYMNPQGPNPADRGILADKVVSPAISDVLQKRDVVMERALELAGKSLK